MFYVEPGPAPGMNIAYWGPEIKVGVPQPALNVNMDAHTNVESLQLQLRHRAEDAAGRRSSRTPLTKMPIPIPIPDISRSTRRSALMPPLAKKVEAARRQRQAIRSIQAVLHRRWRRPRASADASPATGTLDVLRYGRVLKAAPARRRPRRGPGLRRPVLRQERHPQHQARRIQAELHADPQRADLHRCRGCRHECDRRIR